MQNLKYGNEISAEYSSLMRSWDEDGFLIKRGFFDSVKVERINQLVDRLWDERRSQNNDVIIDAHLGTDQYRRMLFSDAADDVRKLPYKLNDLYLEHEEIRQIVLDRELTGLIGLLLGNTPLVVNTLNFEYGSQQADHIDTFYMPPKKANCMLATWIALEPITLSAGPLRYYPKSHRIPPFLFSHGKTNAISEELPEFFTYIQKELTQRDIQPKIFTAEPGDLFIWHAQLLHGGSPITDMQKTRKSLVTHYFRKAEYRHLFWRIKQVHENGYYYKRPHQGPSNA